MEFCKGRIPPDTLQIPLEAPKILPLSIFSVYTPVRGGRGGGTAIIEGATFWEQKGQRRREEQPFGITLFLEILVRGSFFVNYNAPFKYTLVDE